MNLAQINAETLAHAPAVLGTLLAVEQAISSAPGETKAQIVANAVLAGAQVAGTHPNVDVASIGQLTALFVGMLNLTGVFKHQRKPQGFAANIAASIREQSIASK